MLVAVSQPKFGRVNGGGTGGLCLVVERVEESAVVVYLWLSGRRLMATHPQGSVSSTTLISCSQQQAHPRETHSQVG